MMMTNLPRIEIRGYHACRAYGSPILNELNTLNF